jgi:ferredoxin
MATVITSECINCGACEPECPNTAIYQGGVEWQAPDGSMHPAISNDIFYIVPEKCTECVGFHDHEACAAVCPVDCCVPDPQRPETHEQLLLRARQLHPEQTIPDDAPSRFKKEGAAEPAPAAAAAGNGHDVAAAAPPAPAPAPAPQAPAASVAKAPLVTGTRGRVEKPVARPAAPRVERRFAGELPGEFETLLADRGARRRRPGSRLGYLLLGLLAVSQGLLGALPAGSKQRLDEAVNDRRFFSPAVATAANIFLNCVLYPLSCAAAAIAAGRVGLFDSSVHGWIFLGLALAVAEAGFRLRESFFGGAPLSENTPLRGAVYGPVLVPAAAVLTSLLGRHATTSSVGFDGFYGGTEFFDDKLERERRYGSVYRLEDRGDAFVLRLEFPRVLPPSTLADELGLAREMPDYDYEVGLQNGTLVVHGRVTDPQVRKLTAVAPAFPPEFTTRVALGAPVEGFRQRYQDKTLEVILPKAS